jgi:hypothetical protein
MKITKVAIKIEVAKIVALGNSGIISTPVTVTLSTKKSIAAELP